MKLSIKNNLIFLKKILIDNELRLIYFFLTISVFNNLSHFIRKNIFGDRIDFWDFHVYWCTAIQYLGGVNPYGGENIKNCLSQFNFDLYFSYPPIVLKFLSFLGLWNLETSKVIWILIVIASFIIILIYSKKIFLYKNTFLLFFLLIFAGGGLVWSALLAGNISIILYSLLAIGIYHLTQRRINIYYLLITIISLAKFPFFIFFTMPIFLYGYKEIKNFIMYLFLTIILYYFQFYLDKTFFISFINSTITYKSEGFLEIHGTGIGIHGLLDLYTNLIYEKFNLEIMKPSGIFAFFIHISLSLTLFLSAFFLFKKKNINTKQERLLISFFIIIFLCCFPRISSYDFYLVIPAFFYLLNNSRIRYMKWGKIIMPILGITFLAIYDSSYPAFVISLLLFICFYSQIKKYDPFYYKNK